MIWDDQTPKMMMPTPQKMPTLRQYTELTKFCHKLNILSLYNMQIYCRNLISCKAALQRLYRKKRYTIIRFFLFIIIIILTFNF